jgi:transposase
MPAQGLTMRRVRELLQLHYGVGASARAIARELGVSRSTVKEYLARSAAADLAWPLPAELTDAVLEEGCLPLAAPSPACAGGWSPIGQRWSAR